MSATEKCHPMICIIARNEFLRKFREFGFTVALLLGFFVVLLSVGLGISNYKRIHTAYQRSNFSTANGDMFGGQKSVQIYRPSDPLSIFNTGMDNILSRRFKVKAGHFVHFASEIESGDAIINIGELFNTFGSFDVGTAVQVFFSLLAILLGYNIISGERENGTLRMMLSNSAPRSSVILGKLIGSYLSIVLPFLIACISSLILIVGVGEIALKVEDWIRLGLFLSISMMYILCSLLLSTLISSIARGSSTSLVASLLLWSILVFVIPNLSAILADFLYPLPSFPEIVARKIAAKEAIMEDKDLADEKRWTQAEREVSRALQEEDAWYERKLDRQLQVARAIARISPLPCYVFSANTLTQTDWEGQKRFMSTLERVRQALQDQPHGEGHLSSFSRRAISLRDSVNRILTDVLLLMLYTVLLFMGTYARFLRYDVT